MIRSTCLTLGKSKSERGASEINGEVAHQWYSEISPGFVGQIKQVKVLGGLALNDVSRFSPFPDPRWSLKHGPCPQGNETDWKLIAIDINDPIAPLVNSESSTYL